MAIMDILKHLAIFVLYASLHWMYFTPSQVVKEETEEVNEGQIEDSEPSYQMITTIEGVGELIEEGDVVDWNYKTSFMDGKLHEDSRTRKGKWKFVVGKGMVIKCLDLALLHMRKGDTVVVKCPPNLAYGFDMWHGGIPDGSTLIYEIEILDFDRPSQN